MTSCGSFTGEEIEALAEGPDGWEDEVHQLRGGPLGYRAEWLELSGLTVHLLRYGAPLRWRSERVGEGLVLNAVLRADGLPRFRGVELTPDHVHVPPPGEPIDYVSPPDTLVLAVCVEPELVADSLGSEEIPSVLRPDPRDLRRLIATCRRTLRTARAARPLEERSARELLLAHLARVLRPGASEPDRRHREFRLVRRAEALVAASTSGDVPSLGAMARDLGVSESTLHRAFVGWVGLSPGRYFVLRRLHAFRRRLMVVAREASPVTRAAFDTGFTHLGRLASDYKEVFGETPSETLRVRAG